MSLFVATSRIYRNSSAQHRFLLVFPLLLRPFAFRSLIRGCHMLLQLAPSIFCDSRRFPLRSCAVREISARRMHGAPVFRSLNQHSWGLCVSGARVLPVGDDFRSQVFIPGSCAGVSRSPNEYSLSRERFPLSVLRSRTYA
jgi:hypothetical protein